MSEKLLLPNLCQEVKEIAEKPESMIGGNIVVKLCNDVLACRELLTDILGRLQNGYDPTDDLEHRIEELL